MSERKFKSYSDAQRAQDYKDVFNSPQGRRVLADLMAAARVFTPIHTTDPLTLAFHQGERNLALRIATFMAYRPEDFVEHAIDLTRELEETLNESRRAAFHYPH